jgi:predicted peptidase
MPLLVRLVVLVFVMPLFAAADDLAARVFTDNDGRTMPYRLLIPPHYDAATKYPVILFFHGSGERGDDNLKQLKHGIPQMTTPELVAKFPAFFIVPQCPLKQGWVNMNWNNLEGTRPAEPSAAEQMALKILDSVESEFSVDKDRVYVMGLSMGGFAVWDCITRFPEKFAAGVPVCGGGEEATVTPVVAQVPVWAFGSSDDPTVKPIRTLHMVEAMMQQGGKPRYYLYTGLGHNSWTTAFSEPELLPWVFKQHLGPRVPVAPVTPTTPTAPGTASAPPKVLVVPVAEPPPVD